MVDQSIPDGRATPEQLAQDVADRVGVSDPRLPELVANAIRYAVMVERERCAKVAESLAMAPLSCPMGHEATCAWHGRRRPDGIRNREPPQ